QLTAKLLSLDDAALELQPIQVDGAATGVAGGKQLAAPVLSEKAAEVLQVGGFSGEARSVVDDVHDDAFGCFVVERQGNSEAWCVLPGSRRAARSCSVWGTAPCR